MKAHLIDAHLLVPLSRSSAKVKIKYQGHLSQKMGVLGALVFHKHILSVKEKEKFKILKSYRLRTKRHLVHVDEQEQKHTVVLECICIVYTKHKVCRGGNMMNHIRKLNCAHINVSLFIT